jgi:hypothetical protein
MTASGIHPNRISGSEAREPLAAASMVVPPSDAFLGGEIPLCRNSKVANHKMGNSYKKSKKINN